MSARRPHRGLRRVLWLLAALALLMAALPVAGAAAHTEADPLVVPLLADGRNDDGDPPIDVGDVEV